MLIQLIGLTTYVNGGSGKRQQRCGHHVVRASSHFLHQFTPVAYFTDGKPHVGLLALLLETPVPAYSDDTSVRTP